MVAQPRVLVAAALLLGFVGICAGSRPDAAVFSCPEEDVKAALMSAQEEILRAAPFLDGNESDFCPKGLECAPYKVLKKTKCGLEVRRYPATKWVSTDVEASFYKAQSRGFQRLFKYISGGNSRGEKMDMTAPVSMRMSPSGEGSYTVSFYLPPEYQKRVPKPGDDAVYIEKRPSFVATVQSFGGWAWEKKLHGMAKDIYSKMEKHGVPADDSAFYFAGFNPPYQIFHRHNEVWVPWKKAPTPDVDSSQLAPNDIITAVDDVIAAVDNIMVNAESDAVSAIDAVEDVMQAVLPAAPECRGLHTQQTCESAGPGCVWCEARAVPSACYPAPVAQRLPPAVFRCLAKPPAT